MLCRPNELLLLSSRIRTRLCLFITVQAGSLFTLHKFFGGLAALLIFESTLIFLLVFCDSSIITSWIDFVHIFIYIFSTITILSLIIMIWIMHYL